MNQLYKKLTKRGTNVTVHPQDYVEMRQEVDKTEQYLNRSLKLLRKYNEASEKHAVSLKEFGEFFSDTGRQNHGEFGECLRRIGRIYVDVSNIRQTQILNVVYIQPITKYSEILFIFKKIQDILLNLKRGANFTKNI
jgi:hypothetical protein